MQVTEVNTHREPTGIMREKNSKWQGTCFTCTRKTKAGMCRALAEGNSYVKRPDLYCKYWE